METTTPLPLYTSDYLDVYSVPEQPKAFRCVWKGEWLDVAGDLKNAFEQCLTFIQEKKYTLLISDCAKIEAVSIEANEYFQNVWYEEAHKLGLRAELIISPEEIISDIALGLLVGEMENSDKVIVQMVENQEKAESLAKELLNA